MYRIRHDRKYARETGHIPLHSKYKRTGYGYTFSMFSDGRIRLNRIVDIYDSGVAPVYRVTTTSGAKIDCTHNHKFPTPFGEKQLSGLSVGDELFMVGNYRKKSKSYRWTDGT